MFRRLLALAAVATLVACTGESSAPIGPADGKANDITAAPPGSSASATVDTADTLDANRTRLFATYAKAEGSRACSLTPSALAVFETLTARLQGSKLASDGRSMLSHIVAIHRIAGGDGATATDPGSCGGGDANRMIMSMDAALHEALVAANADAKNSDGARVIADIPDGGYWRETHDFAGAHAPFDASDETNDGAPRGQVQFFADPTSATANAPLGRLGVEDLVDPYALEMDEDYDCPHHSNPLCSDVTYGPLCFPGASTEGTALFTKKYGDYAPGFVPCGS